MTQAERNKKKKLQYELRRLLPRLLIVRREEQRLTAKFNKIEFALSEIGSPERVRGIRK